MKKLILLIMFPVVCYAQEKSPVNQLSVFFTPEINGLKLHSSDLKQSGNFSTKSKFGFSLGVNLDRKLIPNMTLRTGIGYGLKRCFYENKDSELEYDPLIGVLDAKIQENYELHELQIPFLIKYDIGKYWYCNAGFETNFIIKNSSVGERIAIDGYRLSQKPTYYLGINLAHTIGVGFKIPEINLSIEPQFMYYMRDNVNYDSNMYRVGLKLSYYIKNKK